MLVLVQSKVRFTMKNLYFCLAIIICANIALSQSDQSSATNNDDFEEVSINEKSVGEDISNEVDVSNVDQPKIAYNYTPNDRPNPFIPPVTVSYTHLTLPTKRIV